MSRYQQLLDLIDKHKPKSICEIGVWNGANAIRMINQAAKYHDSIEYIGFDLFEDATLETDQEEFNVKNHNNVRAVSAYIRSEVPPTTKVMLVKGNTRQTLKPGTTADFVFLDGGHSIETIKSDYERLCLNKLVVLDDYYTADENGGCPDTEKYGCNFFFGRDQTIVKEGGYNFKKNDWLFNNNNKLNFNILPAKDPVKGGGYTQLVVVCQ